MSGNNQTQFGSIRYYLMPFQCRERFSIDTDFKPLFKCRITFKQTTNLTIYTSHVLQNKSRNLKAEFFWLKGMLAIQYLMATSEYVDKDHLMQNIETWSDMFVSAFAFRLYHIMIYPEHFFMFYWNLTFLKKAYWQYV